MQTSKIINEVEKNLLGHDFARERILNLIFEAMMTVAGELHIPGLRKKETVAATSAGSTDLPDDYHHSVIQVINTSKNITCDHIYNAMTLFECYDRPSGPEEGDVEAFTVEGDQLLYRKLPATDQSLEVMYYARPEMPQDQDGDEIELIPEHLQRKILVNYPIMMLLDELVLSGDLEQGDVSQKFSQSYQDGVYKLWKFHQNSAKPRRYYPRRVKTF